MTPDRPRSCSPSSAALLTALRAGHKVVADADGLFEALRDAVLDHRLPPGTQLKEQTLADVFGVNRAIVRAALVRLRDARLAEHRSNRGVFVARPSLGEARDIFAARRVIEAAIVELLCATADAGVIHVLRQAVAREQADYRAGNATAGLRQAVAFHRLLARHAGNSVLRDFLEELLGRTPLVMLSFTTADAHVCALDEHSAIIDAIEARDARLALARMDAHIRHLEQRVDGVDRPALAGLTIAAGVEAQAVPGR